MIYFFPLNTVNNPAIKLTAPIIIATRVTPISGINNAETSKAPRAEPIKSTL